MGKGDCRSKRGKIYCGTYGKYRPKRKHKNSLKKEKSAQSQ